MLKLNKYDMRNAKYILATQINEAVIVKRYISSCHKCNGLNLLFICRYYLKKRVLLLHIYKST